MSPVKNRFAYTPYQGANANREREREREGEKKRGENASASIESRTLASRSSDPVGALCVLDASEGDCDGRQDSMESKGPNLSHASLRSLGLA